MTGKAKGNLAMLASKVFSGSNENALRYLLPTWMSAYTGFFLRVSFATIFFWVFGVFNRHKATPATKKQRMQMFALGFFCVFGYMFFLLMGLTYTTPVSSSIFISLQPVCVFTICVCIGKEQASLKKIIGIFTGIGGDMACVLTQKTSDVASNPLLGNIYCAGSMLVYSVYLILSKLLLKKTDTITMSKWTFLGAVIPAAAVALAIPGSEDVDPFRHPC